jgi:magnesium-protoporphyrin O-methyltransferase
MEKMVSLSAERARKMFGLVYPRDTWWIRAGIAVQNLYFRLRRNPYRAFIHPAQRVEALLSSTGLKRKSYRRTLFWQVVVYTR